MNTQRHISRPWSRYQGLFTMTIILVLAGGITWAGKPVKPPPEPPPEPQTGYSLVDLGTLGGVDSVGFKINNFGWIVGGSSDLAGKGHAFVVIPEDTDGDGNLEWFEAGETGDNGLMIDLGVLGGGAAGSSLAWGINDLGQVVGDSTADVAGGYAKRAFLWQDLDGDRVSDPGEMQDLGALNLGGESRALAINDLGQVVGCTGGSTGDHAFLINPKDENGDGTPDTWFAGENGVNELMIDLGNFSVSFGEDLDINDRGEIAGAADGSAFLIRPVVDHAGAPYWFADQNNDGINDLMILLSPVSGAKESRAKAINTLGLIMGESKGGVVQWQVDAAVTVSQLELGGLGNEEITVPYDFNDDGQAVGCALTTRGGQPGHQHITYSSWVSEDGNLVRLSDRVVDWGPFLAEFGIPFTYGINNPGQIVGHAYTASGIHAYLAKPTL